MFLKNEAHRSLYLNEFHSKEPPVFEQRSDSSSSEWKVSWALFLYQKVLLDLCPSGHWDLNNHQEQIYFWTSFVMCYSIFNSSNHTSLKLLKFLLVWTILAYSQFPIFILLYTQRQKNMCPCFINTQFR